MAGALKPAKTIRCGGCSSRRSDRDGVVHFEIFVGVAHRPRRFFLFCEPTFIKR